MASGTRAQGRPPRGVGDVGRARLLDRTRNALNGKPKIDMQRREIALFAGVTPALVSYYYRDKWDLFSAAAKPVIEAYVAEVRGVLRQATSPHLKVFSLVRLFIDFNFHHGYLLDFCLENSDKIETGVLEDLRDVNSGILSFFETLLRDGVLKGDSPTFIQTSLWGLCKYMSQQLHAAQASLPQNKETLILQLAEEVYAVFFNGAATQKFDREFEQETEHCPSYTWKVEHNISMRGEM